jgi:hypothetical protein
MDPLRSHNIKLMRDHEKLAFNGHNFVYWVNTLRIVLRNIQLEYVLDTPLPVVPPALDMDGNHIQEYDDEEEVNNLMLDCVSAELRNLFQDARPSEMMDEMKRMFCH